MASAALMVDGVVKAAAHEERFTRIKADVGFPLKAAQFCIEEAGIDPAEIDVVAISNEWFDINGLTNILFKRPALYSIDDWIRENELFWKPRLIEGKSLASYFDVMGGWDRVEDHHYDLRDIDMTASNDTIKSTFNQIRRDTVERLLGVPKDRVTFMPHYMLHHYHAYYSGNLRGDDVVVVHQEGDGGACNSAVSIPTKNGLKQIGGTNKSDLGRLYQWCTLLMGMKPYHHEYKIMGLAPYATEYEVKKSLKVFQRLFKVETETLSVIYDQKPKDLYFNFLDKFRGHRFDGIAGALQQLIEEKLSEWLSLVLRETGKHQVCYGGGVAMNVKANMLLSQLENVDDFYVPLSPGDETNVFGAGYWATEQHFIKNGRDPEEIPPLDNVYLGPRYSRRSIIAAVDKINIKANGFSVTEGVKNSDIATSLSEGKVIGRFQGKSEYGQRSLGNRSLLANPSAPGVVDKINSQIKYRDFWMPFCPTILDSYAEKCLENPKNISAKFMTICFPVRNEYRDRMAGGIHSGDGTARPQIIEKSTNAEYYDLIEQFSEITGTGALINTSFNLHGEPVVGSPDDALHTLQDSDLDAVWMEDILVSRQSLP